MKGGDRSKATRWRSGVVCPVPLPNQPDWRGSLSVASWHRSRTSGTTRRTVSHNRAGRSSLGPVTESPASAKRCARRLCAKTTRLEQRGQNLDRIVQAFGTTQQARSRPRGKAVAPVATRQPHRPGSDQGLSSRQTGPFSEASRRRARHRRVARRKAAVHPVHSSRKVSAMATCKGGRPCARSAHRNWNSSCRYQSMW